VSSVQNLNVDVALALRAEHICLESDEFVTVQRPNVVRVGPTFRFASTLRGLETELAFCTDRRLAVRCRRPRQPERKYVVDLRFVEVEPVASRRIAWRCWQATLGLAVLGALALWLALRFAGPEWQRVGLQASVVLLTTALCAGVLGWYRTRETIQLRSVHGDAVLAEVAGGLGCAREAGRFQVELGRQVAAARSEAAQSKQQYLRDEMREHHRLWSEGVLSDATYDASKRRILQAHA
jgi:hypothetical protein